MKLAYNIPEVCDLANTGRTGIYAAINSGELIAHIVAIRTRTAIDVRARRAIPPVCGNHAAYNL